MTSQTLKSGTAIMPLSTEPVTYMQNLSCSKPHYTVVSKLDPR